MSRFQKFERVRHIVGGRSGKVVDFDEHEPHCLCVLLDGESTPIWTIADALTRIDAQDTITHPPHYTQHPSGVECIAIAEHFGFCLGNVIKYVWRAGSKGDALEDLKKAKWYLSRDIERREKESAK